MVSAITSLPRSAAGYLPPPCGTLVRTWETTVPERPIHWVVMPDDPAIPVTSDEDANRFLVEDPLALLIGMLLDQQVPMEWAFRGPYTLRERLGGGDRLDASADRRPRSRQGRGAVPRQAGAAPLPRVDGQAHPRALPVPRRRVRRRRRRGVARRAPPATELLARLEELPGLRRGEGQDLPRHPRQAAGVAPPGWEEAAAPFSDATPRSVADIDSPESFQRVREWKRMQKAQKKSKAD